MAYRNATKHLKFTLKADCHNVKMNEYGDASFATHQDAKSRTGACTVFEKGVFTLRSSKN